jgi:transposase
MLCRRFRDRPAVASFAGLTGTPFRSGCMAREQGIGKNGNARVRRIVMQLAWRWLRFQPQSVLAQWSATRTGGAKGRIRTVMFVALARKLLVALWRYVGTGELPAGARVTAA